VTIASLKLIGIVEKALVYFKHTSTAFNDHFAFLVAREKRSLVYVRLGSIQRLTVDFMQNCVVGCQISIFFVNKALLETSCKEVLGFPRNKAEKLV